ncbi:unnamed protein product, partial [Iphiclides podalirius]
MVYSCVNEPVHCDRAELRSLLLAQDYDPLNSGRIGRRQFRRALDSMGLGSILSDAEAACVLRHYTDPNDDERVCWRTFEDDCDQAGHKISLDVYNHGDYRHVLREAVFTIKELEKHPDVRPGAMAAALAELPPPGSATEGQLGGQELDLAEAALLRIRAACNQRAVDLRPIFGDYDPAVRSALSRAGVLPPPRQLRALELRYLDDCGFNFFSLLGDLEEHPEESAVVGRAPPPSSAPPPSAHPDHTDIVQILAKIKGKVQFVDNCRAGFRIQLGASC